MATNVDAKLLKQTKFPPEFSQKVDMKKVNVEVMKKWIAGKISEILGSEDDVVIELCFNLLEGSRFPDIKVLQIQLTGFLDKDTPRFCKELWNLCLSAQSNPQGVPKELLEAKKLELIQEKIDSEKAAEETQRHKEQERTREKNIDNIRQRERAERGRGRGRGDRSYHEYDRRPRRDSRSPPPRRRQSPYRDDFRGPPRRDFRSRQAAIPRASPVTFTQSAIPSIRISLSDSSKEESGRGRRRHRFTGVVGETEGNKSPAVAVIERDPIHLQTRLAHTPPEDPEGSAVLPSYPAAPLLRLTHAIVPLPITRESSKGHWEIKKIPDEDTITIGAEAVAVVNVRTSSLPRKLQAGALAHRGSEKESGIAP
ncbi:MAG: hypothetical protein LQ343_003193 [Gyalolechia ehrenbergii]|nr:MAG: hypothetical protein LQ343_003193 [Gyalolechia ehrenbergii]